MLIEVPAAVGSAKYTVDTTNKTCTCLAFKFSGKPCKHLNPYVTEAEPEPDTKLAADPDTVSQEQKKRIEALDKLVRTRLSKNFILRDFMYSTRADILEISNRPSDHPKHVIKAGKQLCEQILEPLLKKFGRFAITYGYQSRRMIEAGYKKVKHDSSAPHQWDRGTFGDDVYARVDILPFAAEDQEHSKYEIGNWMMANLDIDLLMLWHHSNVMCVTISPQPRRVYLEWFPYGKGEGGSNKKTYMGEDFWQNVWPYLDEIERPRFGPSCSGGKMFL